MVPLTVILTRYFQLFLSVSVRSSCRNVLFFMGGLNISSHDYRPMTGTVSWQEKWFSRQSVVSLDTGELVFLLFVFPFCTPSLNAAEECRNDAFLRPLVWIGSLPLGVVFVSENTKRPKAAGTAAEIGVSAPLCLFFFPPACCARPPCKSSAVVTEVTANKTSSWRRTAAALMDSNAGEVRLSSYSMCGLPEETCEQGKASTCSISLHISQRGICAAINRLMIFLFFFFYSEWVGDFATKLIPPCCTGGLLTASS